ncbi:MAG TPA: sirohydrochlorin chelatase [Acidimicrobiales bacterium]|nr:sirohydrochlorin chelatase [Acidimicrobiales bacterium]
MPADPALLVIGHGSRDHAGVAEYWRFVDQVARATDAPVGGGFIELAEPDLDTAIDKLIADGAERIVGVPLVLLGAGHMKLDGPAALDRGRRRHPHVHFDYGRALGIHPLVLDVAADRIPRDTDAVVVVGRGSSDPDANADLFKIARLLQDATGVPIVEPAFVSLAEPRVPAAIARCHRLGAASIAVVPYFLFTGVLVERIGEQARANGAVPHPHLGVDSRLVALVLERYREALAGDAHMNCDGCKYRLAAAVHVHDHNTH